ncbi:MAG: gluconate 2-dehydrogenase subunit 3 family protein [Longimicrobiales bacterium]
MTDDISRRQALGIIAAMPLALGDVASIERAAESARRALARRTTTGEAFIPDFFTPEEWRTVRVLVDIIIPRDERSGSANDAGVPEYMDFIVLDRPRMQPDMRDGLKWLDDESRRRFNAGFADLETSQQTAILDDIAWPERARPEMEEGVRFFNFFRDQTASGFWSSRMGVEDLRYMGNTYVAQWNGCPPEALEKLGVSYAEWERR